MRNSGDASLGFTSSNAISSPAQSRRVLRPNSTRSWLSAPICLARWRTATSKAIETCPGSTSRSAPFQSPSWLTATGVPFTCARTWNSMPSTTSGTLIATGTSLVGLKYPSDTFRKSSRFLIVRSSISAAVESDDSRAGASFRYSDQ